MEASWLPIMGTLPSISVMFANIRNFIPSVQEVGLIPLLTCLSCKYTYMVIFNVVRAGWPQQVRKISAMVLLNFKLSLLMILLTKLAKTALPGGIGPVWLPAGMSQASGVRTSLSLQSLPSSIHEPISKIQYHSVHCETRPNIAYIIVARGTQTSSLRSHNNSPLPKQYYSSSKHHSLVRRTSPPTENCCAIVVKKSEYLGLIYSSKDCMQLLFDWMNSCIKNCPNCILHVGLWLVSVHGVYMETSKPGRHAILLLLVLVWVHINN